MVAEKLSDLYLIAENEDIKILSYSFSNTRSACCFVQDHDEYIMVDYHSIKTENIESVLLAEEIGHLQTGSTYTLTDYNEPLKEINILKAEAKGRWRAVELLGIVDQIKKTLDDPFITSPEDAAYEIGIDIDLYSFAVNKALSRGLL